VTRFQLRSVRADAGAVLVHVTAIFPLGITKEIYVRLAPDDARRLMATTHTALSEIGAAQPKLGA
jgi:hypothetical protein